MPNGTRQLQWCVIAGPNGAGKTTFARAFLPHRPGSCPVIMKRAKKDRFALAKRGEIAFRTAVAKVVKQHRETGVPLAVWSKVALGPVSKLNLTRSGK